MRATGILFAVTILVSEILKSDSPSPTGPAQEIATFFEDHRSTILAGAYVQMLALFLLAFLFAASADELLPQAARSRGGSAASGSCSCPSPIRATSS